MVELNMEDVISVLNACKPHLIVMAAALIAAVIVSIVAGRMPAKKKKLVRAQSWIAFLAVIAVALNMAFWGPLSTMVTVATSEKVELQEDTISRVTDLSETVAEEGIVLLKNEDGTLPLSDTKKVNVFGWASTNPCYGGTGSGGASDAFEMVGVLEGLANAGFEYNGELSDFYTAYREQRPEVGILGQDWTLPEPPADTYSQTLIDGAKAFSDTAVVVISRIGGEGADLPVQIAGNESIEYTDNSEAYQDFDEGEHYLQLSRSERDMLDLVCDNFDKVVLVYNGANTLEMGFVNDYPQITGALWCPGAGRAGFNALGRVLSGEVNPSGRTADTFVADLTATPVAANFGKFYYDNMGEFGTENGATEIVLIDGNKASGVQTPSFSNYVEGIYVGYRFYETAAQEGLIDYDATVVYPFGYGLSYTSFSQEMGELKVDGDTVSVDVTVTNTGDAAGKTVVQVYDCPPYINGGVEKSSVNLMCFAKTNLLKPGENQTLTLSFLLEDMASYDSNAGAYVLEAGDYEISINENAHTRIDSKTYHLDDAITYDEAAGGRSTDDATATNQFAFAEGNVTYLSRADGFANYGQATAAPSDFTMPEESKALFYNLVNYEVTDYNNDDDKMPETGKDNGLTLADLRGADYDDPQWEKLLDQMTADEMEQLIGYAGYQTPAIKSIGKVATYDFDGPSSINNNMKNVSSVPLPPSVMLACTWNVELAQQYGDAIGTEAEELDVSGWYAPAMNTHRNAFTGRNFEYYSEDGLLAGKMAAATIQGVSEHGVYVYIKHFAMNEQESNRANQLCTWATEQSIREIYLKPFELAVKEGKATAVMSAFNFIGPKWCGASEELLVNVLRGEWGFRGFVLTDYFKQTGFMNADQGIRNGNDAMLIAYDSKYNNLRDKKSATALIAMRQACKNILYTVVNSRAYAQGSTAAGMTPVQKAVCGVDVVLAALVVLLEVLAIRKYRRKA